MKVLITGGKGYIARNLVPLLEANGYEVLAPSRPELDLLNLPWVDDYLQKNPPDVIIHTAAKVGRRQKQDTWEDIYVPNVTMWENLAFAAYRLRRKPIVITFGSGAEFDRRWPINRVYEGTVTTQWPIDPYGLSKNIITRRALQNDDTYVLRLFGCFNWDDDPTCYIKSGILNLKRGLAVTVHQNKEMDFFYLNDIYHVIDHIIQVGNCPRHINLVYKNKVTLLDIASLIHKHVNRFDPVINLVEMGIGDAYTGSGNLLASLPIHLSGLEEGIRQTVLKLT